KDASIIIWDTVSGRKVHHFKEGPFGEPKPDAGHNKAVNRIAFSPDGRRIASASSDGTAKIWDVETGKVLLTFTGHSGEVLGVAFRSDGAQVASCGEDRRIRLWDPQTGQEKEFLEVFWVQEDVKKKAERKEMRRGIRNPEDKPVVQVVYNTDGKRLATTTFGGRGQQGHWAIRIGDAGTGREERKLEGPDSRDGLFRAFAGDRELLVAPPGYGMVRWDLEGAPVRLASEPVPQPGSIVLSADGVHHA